MATQERRRAAYNIAHRHIDKIIHAWLPQMAWGMGLERLNSSEGVAAVAAMIDEILAKDDSMRATTQQAAAEKPAEKPPA